MTKFTTDPRSLQVDYGGPRLSVAVLGERLFRVRFAPEGRFAPRRSWAVARADDEFAPAPFTVDEQADALLLKTGAVSVRIERRAPQLGFVDAAGRAFCVDCEPMAERRARKHIAADERFYGFGQRMGLLEKTGQRLVNWTTDPARAHGSDLEQMYLAIPIYLGLRPGLAYGVFFNNTWRSAFDVGHEQPGVLQMSADGGELDYYVACGPTPAEVLQSWRDLLGAMPLPPRWALGHHQSRWGYRSAEDFRRLADEFRARRLPCDAFHFDIDYMRGYRVFTWHPERFPNPKSLISNLNAAGFRAVTIIDPGVKADPDYAVYRDGLAHDYFIRGADGQVVHGYVWPDDSVFADFARPEVRTWWGGLQRVLTEAGVSGVWNDMNEPVVFDKPFSEGGGGVGTLPLDAVQGPADEQTTHAELHNLFGLQMARASYEGLRRLLGDERPFVLTRSGYAGVQRWSACWMGDNNSWWEHLEAALPQLCNMGLSGVPFVGVDIGGFGHNASGELLARWIQVGALLPFCRNHSAWDTARQEPWVFGERIESIYRDYLNLRYRLLPYLYTLFWEAAQTGAPILRPLLYHFPDEPQTAHLHDQVLLGPSLLAAPILRPGRTHRAVYLPAGEWYDWHTGERFAGPAHVLAYAPLERMPLYARAGAILPLGPELQHTDEKPLDPLTLLVFPGDGDFTLYEDDGRTFAYERGEWCLTRYALRRSGDTLTLRASPREGRYAPPPRTVVVKVLGGGEAGRADDPEGWVVTLRL
jgi:alpha-glucosidase